MNAPTSRRQTLPHSSEGSPVAANGFWTYGLWTDSLWTDGLWTDGLGNQLRSIEKAGSASRSIGHWSWGFVLSNRWRLLCFGVWLVVIGWFSVGGFSHVLRVGTFEGVGDHSGKATPVTVAQSNAASRALSGTASNNNAGDKQLQRFVFGERHMGVEFKLIVYCPDEETANAGAKAAFARVAALNQVMSDYVPTSELMQLCRKSAPGHPVEVSDDLFLVLSRAEELSKSTDGAFDVSVGPLTQLWRRSRRQKALPSQRLLEKALSRVGYQFVRLDPQQRTVELLRENMRLDLGGIAAGYAADEALKTLRQQGIKRALVDSSGDIVAGDPPPQTDGWVIGVVPLDPQATPSQFLKLAQAAVSTSGDAFQFVELNGRRYSHIVDPVTGLGLTTRTSVTVVAPSCLQADSLATAVTVLGPQRGLKLIHKRPKTHAFIVQAQDASSQATVQTFGSEGWQTLNFTQPPQENKSAQPRPQRSPQANEKE